ncbi:LytTR family two component transcriptional regulator [Croceitalea dokdonensis DOKDO 023]|uniref:LytTR family two component transcriptional regulator n=1 Tax=Croceitalea dokdonensis DOKDO 023 TaxID=1300341 RepID=A0A0P7ASZ3_9FLAO|nr:LytTR family DNA-binding domain-containing protein [Croceitalea dokdonensis]KPM31496.1 LytTR family two component transcriptional regulator [Croceitalea dokdonensis DOKDO 023]
MEQKLKIVIVEDEPVSNIYLKNLIQETRIQHEIVKELDCVVDALAYFVANPKVDLIFMDIHLGDGTCFDILNTIAIDTPIIFCTTFDTYAIQAFKYNSIDYILKPAKIDNIRAALNKFLSINQSEQQNYLGRIDQMMDSFTPPQFKKRFLIKENNKLKIVDINNVNFFYSKDGQTFIVEKTGCEHPVDYTLERLEDLLDPEDFFRINRKTTININQIFSVEDYFNSRLKIKLQNNKKDLDLVVSRNRVKYFKNWLKGVS